MRQNKAQWLVIIVVAIIYCLGLLMIFSTSSAEVLDHALHKSTHGSLIKHLCYALGGVALGYTAWRIGYERLLNCSPYITASLTLLLLLVLMPGIGREVNGSKRWLSLGGLSFQPSEFVKYFIPAFFIHLFLQVKKLEIKRYLQWMCWLAAPLFLVLIEPNNGTAGVIFLGLLFVFMLMGVPARFWALPLGIAIVIGAIFAFQSSYVSARLKVYLHPEMDLKGKGHQPYQAKIAVGSGGLLGKGPGNSLQKLSYLPEAQNDYIAAIYGEEWGFLGMLALITLYLLLAFGGFTIAFYAPNPAGLYFGGVITFLITFQAFLNMGVVSGLLPSTGLNLPLFSQGGSSLMANMMGLGILLSIPTQRSRL
jgi:cell division protein FtsW